MDHQTSIERPNANNNLDSIGGDIGDGMGTPAAIPSLWSSQLPSVSSSHPSRRHGHDHGDARRTAAAAAVVHQQPFPSSSYTTPQSARTNPRHRPHQYRHSSSAASGAPSSMDDRTRPSTALTRVRSSSTSPMSSYAPHDAYDAGAHLHLRFATPLPPDSPMTPASSALSSLLLPPSTPGSSLAKLTELTNQRMKRFQALYDRHSGGGGGGPTDGSLSAKLQVWNERKNDEKKSFESTIGAITRITQHRCHDEMYIGKSLVDDVYIRDEVQRHKHEFYKFVLPSNATSLKIEVEVVEGKLDMFVSTSELYVFYAEAKSGKRDYQWQTNNVNAHRLIIINQQNDPTFKTGDYYISIYGHVQTTYTLKATMNAKGNAVRAGKTPASNLQSRQNIRRRLDARVRTLLENKQAMMEFRSEIGKIKDDFRQSEQAKLYSTPAVKRNIMVANLSVDQHRPREVKARRQQLSQQLEKRLVIADETAKRLLAEKQYRTCHDIEKREELRLANREAQRIGRERAIVERIQCRWLYWMTRIIHDQYWVNTLSNIKMMRFQRRRRERRARIIQRFVRHHLQLRRLHRAHSHLQSLRSVVLFCASSHQLIKKDRAANLIIAFLESVRGVNRLSRIVIVRMVSWF